MKVGQINNHECDIDSKHCAREREASRKGSLDNTQIPNNIRMSTDQLDEAPRPPDALESTESASLCGYSACKILTVGSVILLYTVCFFVVLVLSNILMNSDQSQCLSNRKSFLYSDTVGRFLALMWLIYLSFLVAFVALPLIVAISVLCNCRWNCGGGFTGQDVLWILALIAFVALKPLWLIVEGIGFLAGTEMQHCSSSFTVFFAFLIAGNVLQYCVWALPLIQMKL